MGSIPINQQPRTSILGEMYQTEIDRLTYLLQRFILRGAIVNGGEETHSSLLAHTSATCEHPLA